MQTLKQAAIESLSRVPDTAELDELMYRLYVLGKIRAGRDSAEAEPRVQVDTLRREIDTW